MKQSKIRKMTNENLKKTLSKIPDTLKDLREAIKGMIK